MSSCFPNGLSTMVSCLTHYQLPDIDGLRNLSKPVWHNLVREISILARRGSHAGGKFSEGNRTTLADMVELCPITISQPWLWNAVKVMLEPPGTCSRW
jgi:hypothetical protein